MRFNVHAGHNPDGKIASGAKGILLESTENRKVKQELINELRKEGHQVYDCTVDNGTSQLDVLQKIVAKCNQQKVDLDISIHFNSGRNDFLGDGMTGGTECWIYPRSLARTYGQRITSEIGNLGFRNRGVKVSSELYVLRKTRSPAVLVECCFVDDQDDVTLYQPKSMAKAIAQGILGSTKKDPFFVKVIVPVLNVRSGPGVQYPVRRTVRQNEVYTIVEEQNGWGRLKSGAGWISLHYTNPLW